MEWQLLRSLISVGVSSEIDEAFLGSSCARRKGCDVMKMKKGGRTRGRREGRRTGWEGVACKV